MSSRLAIPEDAKFRVLYDNADKCCVCHQRNVVIHHIDEDPANNSVENLAVLCLGCHGEAHTSHKLSQNLTPDRIRHAKKSWELEVSDALAKGMRPITGFQEAAIWSYVNHDKLYSVLRSHGLDYDWTYLQQLLNEGIVNQIGAPLPIIEPSLGPDEFVTLYDRVPFHHRSLLIHVYGVAIGQLIQKARPIDFRQLIRSSQIRSLAGQGALCYFLRGFHFRPDPVRPDRSQIRHVHTAVSRVSVRFLVDTKLMYGTSALVDSFVGHRETAVLAVSKGFSSENGKCVLHCTPLAMGTGFFNRAKARPDPELDQTLS